MGIQCRAETGIAGFYQYEHLADLQEVLKIHKDLKAALGGDYLITPDIVVARRPLTDAEINRRLSRSKLSAKDCVSSIARTHHLSTRGDRGMSRRATSSGPRRGAHAVRKDPRSDARRPARPRRGERRSPSRHHRDHRAGTGARRVGPVSVQRQRGTDGRVGQRTRRSRAVPVQERSAGGWRSGARDGIGCGQVRGVTSVPNPPLRGAERGNLPLSS